MDRLWQEQDRDEQLVRLKVKEPGKIYQDGVFYLSEAGQQRINIPTSMRYEVMEELHEKLDHVGSGKMMECDGT